MIKSIVVGIIIGVSVEVAKIVLNELIKFIKNKFIHQSTTSGLPPRTPTRDQSLDPVPLRGDTRRQAEGATFLVAPSGGSVLVCDECQGLPYGVSRRLPLDTLRLYRLRRNGVKGGRSPFTLPLTEREPTHLPARDRVATLSLCPTASD